MVCAAVACLPAAVNLLFLEALFMQISGVSLALTWPCRLCLLRVLLCVTLCYKLSPFQAHWGRWHWAAFSGLLVFLQFTWEVGLLPSPVEFSSLRHFYKLYCSWLLGVCRCSCLLQPARLFTVLGGISLPCSLALRAPHPVCYVSFFCCCYCLLFSFSFFLGWGLVCPGGYADLAQGCLWEYRIPLSSPCGLRLTKPSGHWRLVVAQEPCCFLPSTWSGDALHRLEVWRSQSFASSQWFFPVRWISSISARFYFRMHKELCILKSWYLWYMKVYSDLKTKRGCPKDPSPCSPYLFFSPTLTSLSVDHCPQSNKDTGMI
jgi:hypothetical protein